MKSTKRLTLAAILISLALALSFLERLMPLELLLPLPGFKLGLANIVTLVAIYLLGGRAACLIVAARCTLSSLFGGGVTGFLFSLTGGMLAVCVMLLAGNAPFFSIHGVSILGAAAHNTGQILVSSVLMGTWRVFGYLPYLLLVSILTGFLTATVSAGVLRILALSGENASRTHTKS